MAHDLNWRIAFLWSYKLK